ncbi:O-antigen ligase family protein [Paracoccus aurantiacus]|uniref:O-antigen ligase family protein n=1 Tax=Paracoccus aurantiacus TaxID=2599412 RepID=A0A5C6S032_9RHOB|nr:O-antigen ligase family protein [Paracoccus aurantiacus]TXB67713.1 O-antigen ligase family protein [Paracoccus aurantiacus]
MTQTAGRMLPRLMVILLIVSTVFNDLRPLLPLGELAKDGFSYLFPVAFLLFLRRPGQIALPTGFTIIFLAFIATIVISVAINYGEVSTAHFKGRSGMSRVITQGMSVALGAMVVMVFYNLSRYDQLRDISRGAEIALLTMAAVGVLEVTSWYGIPGLSQFYGGLSLLVHAEVNDFYPIRMRMTAFEASWAAVMMSFIFPFAMTRATGKKLFIYAGIVVVSMFLAQSRTAMLVIGLQFMILMLAFMRRRKDLLLHCVTACFVLALAVFATPGVRENVVLKVSNMIEYGSSEGLIDPSGGDENMSNVTRLAAVRAGMAMFHDRPVFGIGFGQYGFNYPNYIKMDDMRSWEVRSYVTEADIELGWPPVYSLHVRLLAEVGLLGYLFWMLAIVPTLLRSLFMADGATYLGRMHLAVAMTLIGWMLLGVSIDSFRFFGGWIALGVGLALPRPPRSSGHHRITSPSGEAS